MVEKAVNSTSKAASSQVLKRWLVEKAMRDYATSRGKIEKEKEGGSMVIEIGVSITQHISHCRRTTPPLLVSIAVMTCKQV